MGEQIIWNMLSFCDIIKHIATFNHFCSVFHCLFIVCLKIWKISCKKLQKKIKFKVILELQYENWQFFKTWSKQVMYKLFLLIYDNLFYLVFSNQSFFVNHFYWQIINFALSVELLRSTSCPHWFKETLNFRPQ